MIRWYTSPGGEYCGSCRKEIAKGERKGYDYDIDGGEQAHCESCLMEED